MKPTARPIREQYWAKAPVDEIANEIRKKFEDHLQWLHDTGHANKMQKSYDQYYGDKIGGFDVEMADESISKISVNHYKNLLSRIHAMTVQAKLNFQPKAENSNSKTLLECDLGKGLLQYEVEDGKLASKSSELVESGLVLFGGVIYAPWNKRRGRDIRPDANGRMIKEGDQEYYNLCAFQAARSHHIEDTPYWIVETTENRYDLAVEYPDKADYILSAPVEYNPKQLVTPYSNSESLVSDEDAVKVLTLIHKPTTALKSGRITKIIGTEWLEDGAYDYKHMPVIELKASSRLQEQIADTPASVLYGLQQILDRVYSANISNVLNNCVSNIYSTDPNISISQIKKGQNLIIAAHKPEALALTGVSPDATNLNNDVVNQLTLLSGINNTARGNPEASLKSGTSLTVILATAIQYIAPLQQRYASAMAELGTVIIGNLQKFCSEEKISFIAGVNGKASAKKFKASDLMNINTVSVELGNPISQNFSGRMEVVQMLMQFGSVKDPRKIDDFLRTGNWEALTEDAWNENILIREENELLRRGKIPSCLMYDTHPKHIQEHLTVLYSQDARNDPAIVEAVTAHINKHKELAKTMDPDVAAILGIQPLPSMMQPPPGAGAPGPNQDPTNPQVMGGSMPSGDQLPEGFQAGYQEFAEQTAQNPAAVVPE